MQSDVPVPQNDYILIEPIQIEQKSDYLLPDTAQFLRPARVLDTGPDECLMHFFDGRSTSVGLVRKSLCFPGVVIGAVVLYRRVAEERLTMDGGYRKILEDGRSVIQLKILDVISVLPSHD